MADSEVLSQLTAHTTARAKVLGQLRRNRGWVKDGQVYGNAMTRDPGGGPAGGWLVPCVLHFILWFAGA